MLLVIKLCFLINRARTAGVERRGQVTAAFQVLLGSVDLVVVDIERRHRERL